MSDPHIVPGQPDRTARVWQSTDFLHPDGPGESFRLVRWSERHLKNFEFPPPPPTLTPEPSAADQALAVEDDWDAPPETNELALPAPVDVEPAVEGGVSQQALEEARLEAYAKGQEHGRHEARLEMQKAGEQTEQQLRARIDALEAAVTELRQNPERLHEPLKRLALHLAEQLVLGELAQSPQAIERLVRRCVEELGSRQATVQVELHPDDLALLQPWLAHPPAETGAEGEAGRSEAGSAWHLVPNEQLRPGSVRVSADDAVVSDLIEHRLDALARQLLLDPQRSARQSAFQPDRLASRRSDAQTVLDAQPRMAEAGRRNRFASVVDAETVVSPPAASDTPGAEGDAPPASEEPGA